MISRYTLPEMGKIWTQQNKYQKWLDVELAVCEVQAERNEIPESSWVIIKEKAGFDCARIDEIEAETHHDVIAFLTSVAEHVGPESRYIHLGMTSSDVLDTATSLQIKEAGKIILHKLKQFRKALATRAVEHSHTVCIGRSHGIHAEPTTFGLKLAMWYDEAGRNIQRLESGIKSASTGKISGAVGTFAHLDPEVEEAVCERLDIAAAPISTQVVQRDRHAEFLNAIALIGASLEKIAVEIRHLQRTEVLEVEEYFAKGQKGSSAMPHKRNPIISERVTGLARLLRTNAQAGMENVALWHERDISHSSVERIILPDSTILIDYMLDKMTKLIANLLIYPENMKKNLDKTKGLIFSQVLLLRLVGKGITREKAYKMVQAPSMKCWETGRSFQSIVIETEQISELLTEKEILECFNLDVQLRNVDAMFKRVGLKTGQASF
ncbi:adenylosuccinate lyase [bacterium]|nr:adenylosuccinate lyase [bacterium]